MIAFNASYPLSFGLPCITSSTIDTAPGLITAVATDNNSTTVMLGLNSLILFSEVSLNISFTTFPVLSDSNWKIAELSLAIDSATAQSLKSA